MPTPYSRAMLQVLLMPRPAPGAARPAGLSHLGRQVTTPFNDDLHLEGRDPNTMLAVGEVERGIGAPVRQGLGGQWGTGTTETEKLRHGDTQDASRRFAG